MKELLGAVDITYDLRITDRVMCRYEELWKPSSIYLERFILL